MTEEANNFPIVDGTEDLADLVDQTLPIDGDNNQNQDNDNDDKNKPKDNNQTTDNDDPDNDDDNVLNTGDLPEDLDDNNNNDDPDNDNENNDDDDIEEPNGLNEKQQAAFKSMREKISELKKETENKSSEFTSEKEKEYQQKISDMQARVSASELAQTEEFQEKYSKPIVDTQAEIVRIAEEYDISKDVALQAAKMKRADRSQLLRQEASDQAAVSELMPLYQELEKRIRSGREALQNHEKTRQELIKQDSVKTEELTGEEFDKTLKNLQDEHFLLRDSKQNPQWLKAIKHNAKLLLSGKLEPEQIVAAALKSQVADSYKTMLLNQREKYEAQIAALESKYGKIKGSQPKVKDGTTKKTTSKNKEYKSVEDLVNDTLIPS